MDCPFCNFIVQTECYVDDRATTGVIVVEDLDRKQWDKRLLAVIANASGHRHQPTDEQIRLLKEGLARAIAHSSLQQFVKVGEDYTEMTYIHHFHCQWHLQKQ